MHAMRRGNVLENTQFVAEAEKIRMEIEKQKSLAGGIRWPDSP